MGLSTVKIFFIVLFLATCLSGKTIYVSSSTGDNGNDGLSEGAPKQTLSAITATLIEPGDIIALKCGDVWRETFTVPEAGTNVAINTLTHYGDTSLGLPVILGSDDISSASYQWDLSSSGTNEYYLSAAGGGNPSVSQPPILFIDGFKADSAVSVADGGGIGTLWNHRFKYGDNDGLGYNTIYCRFNGGDPDVIGTSVEYPDRNFGITFGATGAFWRYDGIIIKNNKSVCYRMTASADSLVFENCTFANAYTSWCTMVDPVRYWAKTCKFENCYTSTNAAGVIISGSTNNNAKFIQCSFKTCGFRVITPISTATTSTVDIVNCTFYGSLAQAVYLSSATTTDVTINNSIILAQCLNRLTNAPLDNSSSAGGSITITNSYWDLNPRQPNETYSTKNVTIGTGNVLTETPLIAQHRNRGQVYLQCDDDVNFMEFLEVRDFANPLGIRLSFGLSHPERVTSEMWDSLGSWLTGGNDISIHTMSHWYMSSYTAFHLQYTGAGTAATMTIDTAAKTLTTTVTGGPGGEDLNIDITAYATVDDLTSYINGLTPYTAVSKEGQTNCPFTDNFNSDRLLILPQSAADIKTTVDSIYWNYGRQYEYQINGCKQWIIDSLGFTPTTLVYPAGEYNDSLFYYMTQDGLLFGRAVDPAFYNINNVFDVFTMPTHNTTSVFETDSAGANRGAAAVINAACYSGSYMGIYSHYSTTQFPAYKGIIAKLSEMSGACTVPSTTTDCRDTMDAIGESYQGGRYKQFAWYDSTDLRLQPTSYHINKADTTAISGIPNLYNLNGVQLTGASGELLMDSVNIGAYSSTYTLNIDSLGTNHPNGSDSARIGVDSVFIYVDLGSNTVDSLWFGVKITNLNFTVNKIAFLAPSVTAGWYGDTIVITNGTLTDTLFNDSVYIYPFSPAITTDLTSPVTCSLGVQCTLFVAHDGDSIQWQIYKSGAWSDTVSNYDTLFRTNYYADRNDSARAILLYGGVPVDTSTVAGFNLLWDDVATSAIVSPSSASCDTGKTVQFSATFYDLTGNTTVNHDAVVWSTDATGPTEGSIDGGTGLFTAGTAYGGPYVITGTAGAVTDDAEVTVVAPSGVNNRSNWTSWSWRNRWLRW